MSKAEEILETWVFRARWLLAPFFVGLLLAILALLYKFVKQLWDLVVLVLGLDAGAAANGSAANGGGAELVGETFAVMASDGAVIIAILTLVDSALIAALLLIIGFSGYENFVSKISTGHHEDRPAWMGKVGFSDLKIKLMGAIVAISAVELLKAFIEIDDPDGTVDNVELAWRVGIHMAFVVSGVLFAITDRITESKTGGH